jgi:hypothetical protein
MGLQRSGDTHLLPHDPQFWLSESVVHVVPHSVNGQTQLPFEHEKVAWQARPHAPQLAISVARSLHPSPPQHRSAPVHALAPLQVHAPLVHPSDVVEAQVLGHVRVCPQLFVMVPHATVLHDVVGAQHWFLPAPPTPHGVATPHVFGHVMGWPQLFVVGPHARLLHGVALSVTQQALGPAPPTPHGVATPQVLGHWTV